MKCTVQGRRRSGLQGGDLGRGLLVAALPHVGDAELGEQLDVGGREELGDDDQRDLGGVASGVGAGRVDPVAHLGQPGGRARPAASGRRRRSRVTPLGQQPHDARRSGRSCRSRR